MSSSAITKSALCDSLKKLCEQKPFDKICGDQYETYFFSIVDEADLLAAMESAGVELPACACKEKCVVGAINTDCPVCSVNMASVRA